MSPQNSLPPAGIPDKGNTKYALLALLMVAGIGGLFFWRSTQNKAAPAPLPSALTMPLPPVNTNNKLDDVPMPPPPDEVPDQPQQKTAVRYVGGAAPTGCDGSCKGTPSTELEEALTVRASQARRCYNQALAQDSTLKGHVTVAVRIGPTGNMCSSAVAANDMGSPLVANCAANVFRNAQTYPAPHGGCVDAKVPLAFVPQGQ
jgi:hypothetical protein